VAEPEREHGSLRLFLAVTAAAFLIRLVYLLEIRNFALFDHLISDGRRYDEWAGEIAGGDWLGSEVFYQAPLYPYFLGAIQVVFGRDLFWIRIVQIALGAVSCGLLSLAGWRFFSRSVGLVCGLGLALYAPGIFSDGIFQKTVLDQLLICLLLALLGRIVEAGYRVRTGVWLGAGATLGLLGLTRENSLLWLAILMGWMVAVHSGPSRPPLIRPLAGYLAGLALILLPVGFRNLSVGGEFALTTSQLGPNFYIGNNPEADGTYSALRKGYGDARFERRDATELAQEALGRELSPREVSHYWLGRSWEYMSGKPGEWLALLWRKWMLLWNHVEVEDADDYYLYRENSRLLDTLGSFAHFGVLAPLAAAGLWMTRSSWRRLSVLYLLLASLAFSVAIFYVFGRYRYSIVPLLLPFAAAGVVEGLTLARGGEGRRLLAPLGIWAAATLAVFWPVIEKGEPTGAGYNNLGNALAEAGRDDEALAVYEKALARNRDNLSAHYNLGNLHLKQSELDRARSSFERVLELNPEHAQAWNNLGTVHGRSGERVRALACFERAVQSDPDLVDAQLNLGYSLIRNGRPREAEAPIRRALETDPGSLAAWMALGHQALASGDAGRAEEAFRRALELDPASEPAKKGLQRASLLRGGTKPPP